MAISLTVKLRGWTPTPDEYRGRTMSSGSRRIKPLTHHGPFQRLLDSMPETHLAALSDRSSVVMMTP